MITQVNADRVPTRLDQVAIGGLDSNDVEAEVIANSQRLLRAFFRALTRHRWALLSRIATAAQNNTNKNS